MPVGMFFINFTLAGTLKDGSFPVQPHAFVSIALQQLLDFALITGRYLRESPITAELYL
jgi:hypothetical protein